MKLGAQHVVLGVGQADFSGYPDCRSETMKALQATLRLGLDFPELEIQTPLMWKSKAETFKLAYDLGVLPDIVSNTLTGYDGKEDMLHEWGWGPLDDADFDPASALRAKGWQEIAEQFPYEYAAYCARQGLKGNHLRKKPTSGSSSSSPLTERHSLSRTSRSRTLACGRLRSTPSC